MALWPTAPSGEVFCQEPSDRGAICNPVTGGWRILRFSEEAMAANARLADGVADVAKKANATPSQVALTWLRSRGVAAIPGTRKIERLEENWASQNVTLKTEHLLQLESVLGSLVVGSRY